MRILVANRAEIAVRIMDTAAALGIGTVAVHPDDDAACAHVTHADEAVRLPGTGAAAYLDVEEIVAAALRTGCDTLHPGYGFLAENPALARACAERGITFVGPGPGSLELYGDKTRARAHAEQAAVPVLTGTAGPTDLAAARAFLDGPGPDGAVMVKALAGGGGRGMRPVTRADDLAEAMRRCSAEAQAAFGDSGVYVERLLPRARHVEVQILGDGEDTCVLGDRDCSAQRRRQKLVEIAPAPALPDDVRAGLHDAARRITTGCSGLATVEFLVSGTEFVFLEVNPRIQVEHTVTEEVTGLDLVELGLRVAGGARLADLGLTGTPEARGAAVQARVNTESVTADGTVLPGSGTLTRFQPPTGRGLRVDTHGYAGYPVGPRYDALLAKVIATGPDTPAATARAGRALAGFDVAGVPTNLALLQALLERPEFTNGTLHTGFVDAHLGELADRPRAVTLPDAAGSATGAAGSAAGTHETADATDTAGTTAPACSTTGTTGTASPASTTDTTGPTETTGPTDTIGPTETAGPAGAAVLSAPEGTEPVPSPQQGVVVAIEVTEGDTVAAGAELVVVEAMKMQHAVRAERAGVVDTLTVKVGDTVTAGMPVVFLAATGDDDTAAQTQANTDPDHIRPDLAELLDRRAGVLDAGRPEAIARRHATGRRSVRENLDDLLDPGSFVEYGALTIAAQRARRGFDDLVARTPADGLLTGTGTVDGVAVALLAYDYTVLAGTQGLHNHRKTDRLLRLAARDRLPVVIFAEGGGGRPGDTDTSAVAQLDVPTFRLLAELRGQVPTLAVVAGYCFAGNAALAGACDTIIATEGSSLGMGGPAMIEGGGLGRVAAADVGPMDVQWANGVVDRLVPDDAAAVADARRWLSYFGAAPAGGDAADQRTLRHLVPENRVRAYRLRPVLDTLFDTGSVLELRGGFGTGVLTALARLDGRAVGVLANNPEHLGGAIDADASDKAAAFLELCEAHRLPVVSLCDTPGFMVGPDAERTATVRRFGAMFVAGARLTVPLCTVVLRKAYGLGAMAMAGGDLHAPAITVGWPTAEFGGMGLEGAVRLGYRAELEAIEDPDARRARFDELLADYYERGKALHVATVFEIDDVIDPADTRDVLVRVFAQRDR
ncbi:carboxyl transferase domain-containing protein [Pseudonocardia parietis]|uniref:acetyl-CoA carboxylase n=1 Tax=Pseudonocardia parietis TaxID=570936 RepID=A0ABS4VVB5_9PSEU|nr:carboxyl transferase domain-containing protein [Pseudonocardia parietis]MBP2367860.1 acetyl/propionyl-CoA carboxylase alpha subunit [Pseudonocardia parietis]